MKKKLRELEIFEDLSDDEIQYLSEISILRSYSKDTIIFYKDDEPKYLHVLIEGSVKVYKYNQKSKEVILKILKKPSLIAEVSNFNHIKYPANCATLSDSKILLIEYEKFEKYILQNSQYLMHFMKSLAQSVVDLNRVIAILTLDATAKVAKYIYEFEEDFQNNSHTEIAMLLNITPETFSRIIRKLKDNDILIYKDNVMKINDKEKLKKYF